MTVIEKNVAGELLHVVHMDARAGGSSGRAARKRTSAVSVL
jgi:hypothetical protein